MKNSSRKKTKGSPVRKRTFSLYALGPLTANAFEKKCSTRNAPMGTIPVSDCKRRRRNECPCPARNGATPASFRAELSAGELATVATSDSCTFRIQQANQLLSASVRNEVKKRTRQCSAAIFLA